MRAWSCIAVAAFVAGCGPGDGEGLDSNGRPIGEEGGAGVLEPTFGSIQANVLTPNCAISGCHSGAAAPFGLRLDADSSYALLVGVPSQEVPELNRVTPGDPDNSYVIHKLEGTQETGERMPRGGPYLPQSTIDVIRQWINDGAPPDSDQPDVPPTVVSVAPVDGASLESFPAEIEIIFSEDMDPSLVNASSVLLTASGGDGSFEDGNESPVEAASVSLDPENPRRAIMDLAGVSAPVDSYELRLTTADPVGIADLEGEVLDGDGDGAPGPDFVSTFTVADVLPTLQSIQANVFTPTCSVSGCHSGPPGPDLPDGQDLTSEEASFSSLVDVPSVEVPDLLRVKPGDSDASYLIQKLEGTAEEGDRMPRGGPYLSEATIAAIREWIDAGALFDSASEDSTPPTASVTTPAQSDVVAGVVTIEAAASDETGVVGVTFLVDDVRIGADSSAPYSVEWDSTEVENGAHAITAEAEDAGGNVGRAVVAVTVTNDLEAPTVSLTAPQDGDTVGGVVTLDADASDDIGVTEVDFLVDGTLIDTDAAAPYEIEWDSTGVPDGTHTLTARAHDAADKDTTSDPVEVSVVNDATPPAATITSPLDGETVGGNVPVAVDADAEAVRVDLLVDGDVAGSDSGAPFLIEWDTTTTTDGTHTLVARAVDAAGNEGDSDEVQVTVDNSCTGDETPPTVTLTAPPAGFVTGTVTVSADANDNVGVAQVLFFAGSTLIGSAGTEPFEIDWDTSTENDGPVSLTAQAGDDCGNETTSAAVDVTIDNDPLSVSALAPADGSVSLAMPASIDVTFDEPVDEATVDAASFQLVRSGGDGVFDDGDDVAITATVSASGSTASMDLTGVGFVIDSYRVTLSDTITDLAGIPLDGDGNGEPSGDFVATFRVGVTYTLDAQPIYAEKCDPCHTTEGFGGHNIGSNYEDAFLPTGVFPECFNEGLLVGQCTIVLIQEGMMPQIFPACTGDPLLDAGNDNCLTQEEQDIIQAWIDEGMPE